MESKIEGKTKRKKKAKRTGLIIVLTMVAVLGIGGAIGWSLLMKEHNEAKNLPIAVLDFSKLRDGIYTGEYEGGMYKWRANKAQVTVTSGRVSEIKLLGSSDPGRENTQQDMLYDRVIKAQSLQVDAISSATLTSRAYLKAVENALEQAQK